jgi:hypothetical protein
MRERLLSKRGRDGCDLARSPEKLTTAVRRRGSAPKGDIDDRRHLFATLVQMNEGTLERSGLDPGTFMLARIAALAAAARPRPTS